MKEMLRCQQCLKLPHYLLSGTADASTGAILTTLSESVLCSIKLMKVSVGHEWHIFSVYLSVL